MIGTMGIMVGFNHFPFMGEGGEGEKGGGGLGSIYFNEEGIDISNLRNGRLSCLVVDCSTCIYKVTCSNYRSDGPH